MLYYVHVVVILSFIVNEHRVNRVNDGRRFMFVCTVPLNFLSKQFCTLFSRVWIQSASFLLKSASLSSKNMKFGRIWKLIGPRSCPSNISCVLIGWGKVVIVQNGADWIQINSDWPCDLYDLFSFLFPSFFRFRLPLYQSSLMSVVVIMPSAALLCG